MAMGQMGEFMKRVHGDGKRHGGMGERAGSLPGLAIGPVRISNINGDRAIFLAGLGASAPSSLINGVVCYGVSSGAQKITGSGFMDVQRTCLLIDVSSGAQKITGSGFMDVQRTCLLIDVSSGAQKITGSGFMDVQRSYLSTPAYPTILT